MRLIHLCRATCIASLLMTKLAPISLPMMVGFADVSSAGPMSELYLTQFEGTGGAIVQGNSVIGTFTTGVSTETGIAVLDTIRIVNAFPETGPGSEYDLNGNVINSGVFNNPNFISLYDGTTDGRFNYSIAHNDFTIGFQNVLRFDLNWQRPSVLFTMTPSNRRGSGITYDANTDTLWTTGGLGGNPGADVQQYAMDGTLLSSFSNLSGGDQYGIAWDPADDTLWTSKFSTSTLFQYSKAGELLDIVDYGDALFLNPFGMEFRQFPVSVPEPATWALFAAGLAGLGWMSRRRLGKRSRFIAGSS